MNVHTIAGRLPSDPKVFGGKVMVFSVPTDDGWGDDKVTTWHNVKIVGEKRCKAFHFMKKGTFVCVSGPHIVDKYTTNDGQEKRNEYILMEQITFGPKTQKSSRNDEVPPQHQAQFEKEKAEGTVNLDDVPF